MLRWPVRLTPIYVALSADKPIPLLEIKKSGTLEREDYLSVHVELYIDCYSIQGLDALSRGDYAGGYLRQWR
ncbi:MAG: hypothetical protein ABI325_03390 [Ginsengibacter sp.]